MSAERKKVLEMLADGKISIEEAERLLEKLGGRFHDSEPTSESITEIDRGRSDPPKYLRIVVHSSDQDQVNIRVPLALVRTGIKLSTMLPSEANEKLRSKGIDLSQLSQMQGEELLQALRELKVDVDSKDGDTVRIFCE